MAWATSTTEIYVNSWASGAEEEASSIPYTILLFPDHQYVKRTPPPSYIEDG